MTDRYTFFKQINSIIICGLIALGVAIAYMLLVQFLPKLMNKLSIILGLVFVLMMVLLLVFYPTGSVAIRIIISTIILLLIAIVALGAFKSKACLDMHGVFLYHATQLIKSKIQIVVFIPIFLAVFTLFIVIVIWELKSFWSSAPISFSQEEVYYKFKSGSTTFGTVIVFFQFLWGLSFIK